MKSWYDIRPPESDGPARVLRANFENREAIYIEKGALRVRVSDIRRSGRQTSVWANVEEVPAPGLGVGLFDHRLQKGAEPRRWRIGAGFLSSFSDNGWTMGYGGWTLHFEPSLVRDVLELASHFPDSMDTFQRYDQLVQFVQHHPSFHPQNWEKIFHGP